MTADMATLASQITEFIHAHFPATRGEVDLDTPLLGAGLIDSLGILDIVEHIEDEYSVTIDDDELLADHFESIAEIAAFVASKLSPA